MAFYATVNGTCMRTVCAFPTKKMRDFMVSHADMTTCPAKHAYFVRKMDESNTTYPYNFLDMTIGEYWVEELEPLWDETHDLGLWG